MATEVKLQFAKEKETPNTIRYKEQVGEESPPVLGTLYVQKWWLGTSAPKELTVTISKGG